MCPRSTPQPTCCVTQRRAGLFPHASDVKADVHSLAFMFVFSDCLGSKLQGWLCCPLLSHGAVLLRKKCSTLYLQLRAGVSFSMTDISQGLGPAPSSFPQCTASFTQCAAHFSRVYGSPKQRQIHTSIQAAVFH